MEKPISHRDEPQVRLPFPFHSAAELLEIARAHSLSIDRVMLANECERLRALDPDASSKASQDSLEQRVRIGIEQIWQTMQHVRSAAWPPKGFCRAA